MNEFANPEILKIICHASVGIAVVDLQGNFRFVNESHAQLHHRKVSDYDHLNVMDLPTENVPGLPKFRGILEEFKRGERESFRTDSKFITGTGVEKWFSVESFLVRNEKNDPAALVVVSHDITDRKNLESTLQKIANRLFAIENSDAIGVHYFVRDGQIKCPNEAFRAMIGVTAAEALTLTAKDFTPDEWREQDEVMNRRLFESDRSVSFLKEVRSKTTAKTLPVSITSTRFANDPDFDGVNLVSDLSELFDAREEAEEYRNKADLALGAASIGLWDYSPTTREIIIDDRAREMLDVEKGAAVTADMFISKIATDDVRRVVGALAEAAKCGDQPQVAEFRLQTRNGTRVMRATGRAFRTRHTGEVRVVGTMIDITETKLYEQRILESEEKFRTLAETIPQIVFTADEFGHVNYVNRKWFEFTGQRITEGISREQLREALYPSDLPQVRDKWRTAVENGRAFELEYRMRTATGDYRWVIVRASPLLDRSGKTVRWFGSCTDIDNHRRLNDELFKERNRAQAADKMKSSFLANMSHEIRTPLGAILGFTELLGDGNLPQAERNEYLGIIERNSRSLSRIVDDVLDLSKVEAGLLVLEKVAFSPEVLLKDAVTLFSEKAREKNLTLNMKVEPGIPKSVISDPMRIRQVINNLLSNALKFTEKGGVTIELKRVDKTLQIAVDDTGMGIEKDQLSALFQPFVQIGASMSRKNGGTGLGLHLSRKLSEALGGSLRFEEQTVHPGSRFVFCVPLQEATAVEAETWMKEKGTLKKVSKKDLAGRRILIVDDAADNRKLLERLLVRTGAQISFAEDGKAAIERTQKESFDLIFMDLQMPGIDGFEATEKIRADHITTPIVALTAHAVEEIRERCEHLGFNGFLTKPIDSDSLLKIAKELTSKPPAITQKPVSTPLLQ